MQDFSRFVPNVHFEQIPIKNLVSNQEYQRPLSQTQVEKAIEDFDLNQINPVKVSRRDGINYVFNGQHTIEIVAAVSGSRETPVWCMIYDSLDYRNEADIFANQMKHVRPLKPYEIFMANIEAGNEQQLVIKRLVESYSLTLGPNKGYGVICAIATLERIMGGCTNQRLAPPSGNLTPPRISPSCPHCLSLWLDSEYRSTVSLRDSLPKLLWAGWVSLGHLSRPSFMRSSPHRWVLAHPPHRCSPSSGAR